MEDGASKKNTTFRTTSGTFTDLNFTDELLVQGYWCKRTRVNIFEPEPSISSVMHDPSPYLPFMGRGGIRSSQSLTTAVHVFLPKVYMTNVLISTDAGIDFFSDEETEWETFGNSESIDS
ncbi:hypothetical protein Peur_003777 [Populus x canadensis]